jgi:hypothetical protein
MYAHAIFITDIQRMLNFNEKSGVAKMIGLEYIIQTYHKSSSGVANKIGVSRQTMNDWIKQRKKIPQTRLEDLQGMFPKMPKEYFSKILLQSEELEIQEIYLRETDVWDEYNDFHIDEDGKEHFFTTQVSQNEGLIRQIQNKQEKAKMLERFREIIEGEPYLEHRNTKILERLFNIMETNDKKLINGLMMTIYFLDYVSDDWGFGDDPKFGASDNEEEMYEEFAALFKKYNIIEK